MITGVGVISPIGKDYAEFAENLLAGRSGSGRISLFDASQFSTQVAAEVKGFDPSNHCGVHDAGTDLSSWDRKVQLGVAACQQAIEDTGYRVGQIAPERA